MKIYLSLVGLFLALGLVRCGEIPEELKKLFEECEKEMGISVKGPPNFDDPKVKCFSACLVKKEGLLADGKVVLEKAVESGVKHFHAQDFDKASIIECANKANEGKDECEVSGAFHKCIREKRPH